MFSTALVIICLSFGLKKVTPVIAYFDVKNIVFLLQRSAWNVLIMVSGILQLNLVCKEDQVAKGTLSSSIYMVGVLLGAFIFGILSDL